MRYLLLNAIFLVLFVSAPSYGQQALDTSNMNLERLQSDLKLLAAEKSSRTEAQEKIASGLLIPIRQTRGDVSARALPGMAPATASRIGGVEFVTVDIKGEITQSLIELIEANDGTVLAKSVRYGILNADIPLMSLEAVAESADVRSIFESFKPIPQKQSTSEGDVAHQGPTARQTYGITGDGVKVGVISDSVDHLAATQATGDLPAVTVFSDAPGMSGEGTAMLEIVHDLAPDAELLFGTGFPSTADFVNSIEGLTLAGADIIVDDLFNAIQTPFQDDVIAQAAEDAISAGVHYFTSAGNYGNRNDSTSSVYEADYSPSSYSLENVYPDIHMFTPENDNNATLSPGSAWLFWADPLGASSNDYDLLLYDINFNLISISNTRQNGSGDAVEFVTVPGSFYRLVIARYSGAGRFLHLSMTGASEPQLNLGTSGFIRGQGGAENVFTVAATTAQNRTTAFDGSESVETFSSDGYRRVFFERDGTPITPGNFSSTGGELRIKPEVTAADGIATQSPSPGLNPFFGTSAAAPHAAAIGALLLEADPDLTRSEMMAAFANGALDIEAVGTDRDSGVGIVTATGALSYVLPSYSVTASASPSSQGSASCSPSNVIKGGSASCTAAANSGYQFVNWSGACANASTATCDLINITSDKVSVANFSRTPVIPSIPIVTSTDYGDGEVILTVSVSDDGGANITRYDATCTDGTNTFSGTSTTSPITVSGLTNDVAFTCTATATNSVGTSSASSATDPITPEESVSGLPIWLLYQATVPAVYTVTPTTGANGSITPSTPQQVESGGTVLFVTTADADYGAAAPSGTCPVQVTGEQWLVGPVRNDCSIAASFVPQYSVVINEGDCCGSVTPSGTIMVNEGDSVSFTMVPADGYKVGAFGGPSGEVCPHTMTSGTELGDQVYQIANVTSDCVLNVGFTAIDGS